MDIINLRRSIRKYNEKSISKEEIYKLIRAGMQAPSAVNIQPWRIIAITNKKIINELEKTARGSKILNTATLAIAVCYDDDNPYPMFSPTDCAAVTQNILLQAASMGIGACWIGIYPLNDRMDYVKNVLNTKYKVFSLISLGYSDSDVLNYVDRFDENKMEIVE